jgi:uncharacterized protein (DUF433 family)
VSTPWRVGRKVGRTIYDSANTLIGVLDTPEMAARVVEAVNGASDTPHPRREEGVWIDPARLSGMPCVNGHRIPVEMVVGMVWADGVESAQQTWNLTRGEVLNACWYAAAINVEEPFQRRRGPWRTRWQEWADEAHPHLWRSDYDVAPDPPSRDDFAESEGQL